MIFADFIVATESRSTRHTNVLSRYRIYFKVGTNELRLQTILVVAYYMVIAVSLGTAAADILTRAPPGYLAERAPLGGGGGRRQIMSKAHDDYFLCNY